MAFIAPDALFINPTGTYEGADAIRESLAGLNTDGITFDLSNFRNTDGSVVYDYKVLQGQPARPGHEWAHCRQRR